MKMQINDTWEIDDVVSGLRMKVIPGTKQDRLHVESLTGGTAADDHPKMNRDFWFAKDGRFDATVAVVGCVGEHGLPKAFLNDLTSLINRHSIENMADMPDFLLAGMLCRMIESPREQHSKKPDEVRRRIVELLGDRPRIELFARERPDGWSVWGNEVPCDISLPNGKDETQNG